MDAGVLRDLEAAVAAVPPGRWALGVSGGADSVALLMLLVRAGGRGADLHVVHLDHQTRGEASRGDARFVAQLSAREGIGCTVERRDAIEPLAGELPANRSARFRALRYWLFARECAARGLAGVILAHHALDQAETILQRLVRGSGPGGLLGMKARSTMKGLVVLRPLVGLDPLALRDYLRSLGQAWREDASNASAAYQRNRARGVLTQHAGLRESLHELSKAMGDLVEWIGRETPRLEASFSCARLAELPDVLAREAARAWLLERGAPSDDLSPTVLGRLVTMARDAATACRQHFPGRILVTRKKGRMEAAEVRGPKAGG